MDELRRGEKLTFGVISFYKAQALAIERALKKLGADESRLRVGTVDSFQGMEFDVVFLSMVRTLPENYKGTLVQRIAATPSKTTPMPEQPAQAARPVTEEQPKKRSFFSNIRDALFSSTQKEERRQQEAAAGISLDDAMAPFLQESHEAIKVAEIDAEEQKQAQRLFGHLCLYNRLNVSMSRQKRLLVVAGDSRLLSTELAGRFIPGLVDFYETCQKEGVILQCQR